MNKRSKINETDSTKLERLYEKYKSQMYNSAIKVVKDKQLAEDAIHQSFVKIIGKLYKIDEENPEKTRNFLCIVCRNIAINIYNKRNGITDYIDDIANEETDYSLSPDDIVISKETVDSIIKAIHLLSPIYRDVLLLERKHNYSKKEIAELLNLSYDTVKKRIERGRKKLAEILRKEGIIK